MTSREGVSGDGLAVDVGDTAHGGLSLSYDLFRLYQHVRQLVRTALADAPLQGDEFAVYSALLAHGETTQSALAEEVGMPLTTAAEYVRAMRSKHHIVSRPDPRDGRATLIRLSADGKRAHATTATAFDVMQRHIEENLTIPQDVVREVFRDYGTATVAALQTLREK